MCGNGLNDPLLLFPADIAVLAIQMVPDFAGNKSYLAFLINGERVLGRTNKWLHLGCCCVMNNAV
jgi:hypothetical protein